MDMDKMLATLIAVASAALIVAPAEPGVTSFVRFAHAVG